MGIRVLKVISVRGMGKLEHKDEFMRVVVILAYTCSGLLNHSSAWPPVHDVLVLLVSATPSCFLLK